MKDEQVVKLKTQKWSKRRRLQVVLGGFVGGLVIGLFAPLVHFHFGHVPGIQYVPVAIAGGSWSLVVYYRIRQRISVKRDTIPTGHDPNEPLD